MVCCPTTEERNAMALSWPTIPEKSPGRYFSIQSTFEPPDDLSYSCLQQIMIVESHRKRCCLVNGHR